MDRQTAEELMKLVLVTATADGKIAEGERAIVRRLQEKLGIDDPRLRRLLDETRSGSEPNTWLPRDPADRQNALRLMVITAQMDGTVSDLEQSLLKKMAARLGFDAAAFQAIFQDGIARANWYRGDEVSSDARGESPELRHQTEAIVQKMRQCGSDPAALSQRIDELGHIGASAVAPLVRAFESYLRPSPPAKLTRVKEAIAEALGRIGDPRAVYYLATFLMFGDGEDDTNDAPLRAAVAEAIGRITGQTFPRTADGVAAARAWWSQGGSRRYQTLIS